MTKALIPNDYGDWFKDIKSRITSAHNKIVFTANSEQIKLYHEIGTLILQQQEKNKWGSGVVKRLSSDLREAFPNMKGWSQTTLKYMRNFTVNCKDFQIGQHRADQFPWYHIIILLTKMKFEGAQC